MSQNTNTGLTSVTGSVQLTDPELVTIGNTSAGVLGTVPAGKKWVIVSVWAGAYNGTNIFLTTTAAGRFFGSVAGSGVYNYQTKRTYLVVPAGGTINIAITAGSQGEAGCTYYEIDA